MMHILITGGNGSLGVKLIEKINLEGKILRILSRNDNEKINRKDNRIYYVRGDLLDEDSLIEATKDIDLVIHMAGITHTNRPSEYYEVNVRGTEKLVEACKKNNVKKIIHVSSRTASLAGGDYAISKLFSEDIIKKSGLNWIILKLAEVYGIGCKGGINQLINFVQKYHFAPVIGSGDYTMSPVYISDAVNSILSSMGSDIYGKTYVIAGPEKNTYKEIINKISNYTGTTIFKIHIPIFLLNVLAHLSSIFRLNLIVRDQIPRLLCDKPSDISMAIKYLNYRPKTFDEGLAEYLKIAKYRGN